MTIRLPLLALLTALCPLAAPPAAAQTALTLTGTCERLVIGGQDLSASCRGTLMNTVARSRTSFGFASSEGQSLTFSGTGAQQERTEESDPLQPINLVSPGRSGPEGVVQTPTPAVGSCRFSTPGAGKTAITCEASAGGKDYAGTFVTDAKPAESAQKP
ncbi:MULTISPECIES: hypothetical protein [Methylobacterium]|uniref:hypothetical protein n=1 Tax=Methylobacterium TaxID=407 RepID=UPI0010451C2F|nr:MULTISPECIES: hypothetical protein [Methylobacterium]MDR7038697.1 hypothetical protein [Methylobacterium sp. BE186]